MPLKPPEKLNANERLMRNIWIRASKEGDYSMTFPSPAAARRAKFQLYVFAKSYRDEEADLVDPEMAQAVLDVTIHQPDNGPELQLRFGASSVLAQAFEASTGIAPGELDRQQQEAERQALEEQQARLLKTMVDNPFRREGW